MIELEIISGAHQGTVVKHEGGSLTIGRAMDNTVLVSDYHVSSEHAQIFWEEGQYILRDLRSTNGTILQRGARRIPLNGARQWEMVIQEGDRLLLGDPYSPVTIEVKTLTPPGNSDETRIIASKSLDEIESLHRGASDNIQITRALYKFVQEVSRRGLKLPEIIRGVTDGVFELIDRADYVAIYLKDPYTERFTLSYCRSRDGSEDENSTRSLTHLILQKKAAVLVADAAEELGATDSIMAAKIQAVMGAPLWSGGDIVGILQCDNRRKKGIFSNGDLENLTLLSYHATLAIENAKLYKELEAYKERLQVENVYLKKSRVITFDSIIGRSKVMQNLFAQLRKVLDTRVTIHIQGETGTGKELIATAIHYQSNRRDRMFVAQNCAALPETLLESELFGHVRGAFTGADKDKKGLFEIADGGTLFLDEIAEMSPSLQAKLLRVLQEGEIRPVGSTKVKYVDVRIISATHKLLEEEVSAGRFREDLYYRLHVFPVRLPPLRERRDDIPLLVEHFLEKFSSELHKTVRITESALEELKAYDWPGNVRELENEIHRLVILTDDGAAIQPSDLSVRFKKRPTILVDRVYSPDRTLREMMEEVEKYILERVLEDTGGNKTRAAEKLGITREGLHKKLKRFELNL